MGKVYILAGVLIVITVAAFVWMIMTKLGIKMFSKKTKKEISKCIDERRSLRAAWR